MKDTKTVNLCVPIQINFDEKKLLEIVKNFLNENTKEDIEFGFWDYQFEDISILTCSQCGKYFKQELFTDRPLYCPYCGSRNK